MTQRTSFAKMQRDRDKQAKAAAKRGRRQEKQTEAGEDKAPDLVLDDTMGEVSAADLLVLVETVHRQFDEGTIDFDTFEETKIALLSRLPVD